MDTPLTPVPARTGSIVRAIVVGGLGCGVCDYLFAVIYYKAKFWGIGRSVARGVLDTETIASGAGWIVPLGVMLHFVISLGAATVFVLASRRIAALTRFPVPAGMLYGVLVYLAMNWFVAPLAIRGVVSFAVDWGSLVGHMFVVGLPIALATRWFGPRPEAG
jgi:hypothetical protein